MPFEFEKIEMIGFIKVSEGSFWVKKFQCKWVSKEEYLYLDVITSSNIIGDSDKYNFESKSTIYIFFILTTEFSLQIKLGEAEKTQSGTASNL